MRGFRAVAFAIAASGLFACSQHPLPRAAGSAVDSNADDWPSYNRDLAGNRYSPLAQIGVRNAAHLKRTCTLEFPEAGALQAGPLEIGGTLYVTTAHDSYAVDATTCKLLWENDYRSSGTEPNPVNRGFGWDGGTRLVRGEPDGHLLAIDRASGKTLWDVAPASGRRGEFLSSAPIVWNGLAYIGTAGSDWGAKGRMMAFDVTNGALAWTFDTIADGSDPGAGSWGKVPSAERRGGGLWTSYTLDPAAGELYISVSNPAPDFNPGARPGTNLYTDSLVVLDPRTGKMKWYYQVLPRDSHDWDLSATADLVDDGAERIAALASKDGYIYGIERTTHRLLWKTPGTRMLNYDAVPTAAGVHICPGVLGGAEWNGAAWDAKDRLLITPMVDWCATIRLEPAAHAEGALFMDGDAVRDPRSAARGMLTANDPVTGRVVWRYTSGSPMVAGVTPSAGGVTFSGDMAGNVLVFESRSGRLLFKDRTPGSIAGGVITYAVGGTQYVAATSGNISRFTWGAQGRPSLVIYSL
jgi:PQQ-dependent dehydrogenase (methanol/ethanol family)